MGGGAGAIRAPHDIARAVVEVHAAVGGGGDVADHRGRHASCAVPADGVADQKEVTLLVKLGDFLRRCCSQLELGTNPKSG